MKTIERTICFFVSALLISCASNQNALPADDKEVFREILPVVLDSMYVEISYRMAPAPVKIDSSAGEPEFIIGKKDPGLKEEIRQELLRERQSGMIISFVIDDTIRGFGDSDLEIFGVREIIRTAPKESDYKVNLESLGNLKGVKLINVSDYIPAPEREPYSRVLNKLIFSRIVFNDQGDLGMLSCKFQCGLGCGQGYRIFIRKLVGIWEIDKIEFVYTV
jgi:hypothetical protein